MKQSSKLNCINTQAQFKTKQKTNTRLSYRTTCSTQGPSSGVTWQWHITLDTTGTLKGTQGQEAHSQKRLLWTLACHNMLCLLI